MNTFIDCIPCFFRQALDACKFAGADEEVQKEVVRKLAGILSEFKFDKKPPEMGRVIYNLVKEITGNPDPYKDKKVEFNKKALDLYPKLKEKVNASDDKLLTALRIAIAGNVIDFGAGRGFNLEEEMEEIMEKDFAIFDYEDFKAGINNAKKILYIADNAGEIVFDKVLIEEIKKDVTFAVREHPVINAATMEDALSCGLDKAAELISSGVDAPGALLYLCSDEFISHFKEADLVISKGQGNYEALVGEDKNIFFLFKIKCPPIGGHIGAKLDDIVLKKN